MQSIVIRRNSEIVEFSESLGSLIFNNGVPNESSLLTEYLDFNAKDLKQLLLSQADNNLSVLALVRATHVTVCVTPLSCETDLIELLITRLHNENKEQKDFYLDTIKSKYFLEALSISNIAVWYISSTDRRLYFSDEIESLMNLPNTKASSWSHLKRAIHKKDRALLKDHFLSNLELHNKSSCVIRIVNSFGEKWVEITGVKKEVIEDGNSLIAYFGTVRDCSIEQISVAALNDANDCKRLALEAGNIGTWRAIKIKGVWEWEWDQRANELFELEPDDIGNLEKWANTLDKNDLPRVLASLEVSLETGKEFNESYSAILKNKKVIHVLAKGIVNKKNGINRIDGIVIDQTQSFKYQSELEKKVEERTEELNKALSHSQKISSAKSDFLSMMSHELRTPMNAIVGSLELMELTPQRSFEEKELISTANVAAKNLVQILNDILDLNKVESGKLELEYTDFDLSALIQSVITVFNDSAWQKNVEINVSESQNFPSLVNADEARLKQIVFNLVSNAIKFSANTEQRGCVIISAEFETCPHIPHKLIISVKDNGIGIPKETQKKLFTPFVQAERSTTRKYGGTGLGLAISGRLLDLMGGHFSLESEEGHGSTFSISIPIWKFEENQPDYKFKVSLLNFEQRDEEKLTQKLCEIGCEIATDAEADIIFLAISSEKDFELIANYKHLVACYTEKSIFKNSKRYKNIPHLFLRECTYYRLKNILIAAKQSDINFSEDHCESTIPMQQALIKQVEQEILLIEDNPINQKLIVKQLRNLGYACDIADDGYQGLELFKSGKYSLILTDCHMPELDGYELTRIIRKFEKENKKERTPIIAVTGAAMNGDRALCEESGMDDFLSKPIALQKLKVTVERWLNDSR